MNLLGSAAVWTGLNMGGWTNNPSSKRTTRGANERPKQCRNASHSSKTFSTGVNLQAVTCSAALDNCGWRVKNGLREAVKTESQAQPVICAASWRSLLLSPAERSNGREIYDENLQRFPLRVLRSYNILRLLCSVFCVLCCQRQLWNLICVTQ